MVPHDNNHSQYSGIGELEGVIREAFRTLVEVGSSEKIFKPAEVEGYHRQMNEHLPVQ